MVYSLVSNLESSSKQEYAGTLRFAKNRSSERKTSAFQGSRTRAVSFSLGDLQIIEKKQEAGLIYLSDAANESIALRSWNSYEIMPSFPKKHSE